VTSGELWAAVDALVDRAPRVSDLVYHRLAAFAARRRRATGRPVPDELLREERLAALGAMAAPAALERVLGVCEGPFVLQKGPELARRYPDPALRPLKDLDLLCADPAAAQRALLGAGWEIADPGGQDPGPHHEPALVLPGLPVTIELHGTPHWPDWAPAPPAAEILALAVPSPFGERVRMLPAAQHAVVVAAHAWAHRPLRRVLDLIDVAVLAAEADRMDIDRQARAWGVQRVWRATIAAADAVLAHGARPWPLHVWARDLPAVRERTVLEAALARWLSPFSALDGRAAPAAGWSAFAADLRPEPGSTWREKLARSGTSLRDALRPTSEHLARLGRPDDRR
jgi:Uncharacterised nucleotidyltransferase